MPANGLPFSRAALIDRNDVRAHLAGKIATISIDAKRSAAMPDCVKM